MGSPVHRIKRQVLELKLPPQVHSQSCHSELSRIHHQRIAPLLDRCCTAISSSDCIHRIESLQLDLGCVDVHDLEADLINKLSNELPKALSEQIQKAEPQSSRPVQGTRVKSRLELIVHFARTGGLPWWADPSRPRLIDEALQGLIRNASFPLVRLMRETAREKRPLKRIVLHCEAETLSGLCRLLAADLEPSPARFAKQLVAILQRSSKAAGMNQVRIRNAVWQGILRTACLKGGRSGEPAYFWREVLLQIALDLGLTYAFLVSEIHRLIRLDSRRVSSSIRDITAILSDELQGKAALSHVMPDTLPHELPDALPQDVVPRFRAEDSPVDLSFSAADELFIDNCGIVILWPFLRRFFEHLGLLAEKQFKDTAAIQRAVGLLQYLVTQDPSPPEYLLPLNKVLCGMELTEAFDSGLPVTPSEAEECANLLSAVIGHAPILKNMSIPAFRGTFLLRKGVLGTRDGAWLLRVERETHDVVLDRFPWSVNWVTLPWMDAPMQVEW
jgi:hypothetical protein